MGLLDGVNLINTARVESTTGAGQTDVGTILAQNNAELQNNLTSLYDNPAIDPMSYQDYSPNTASGIQKGTYSGASFSAPIYAPSFVMPLARKDAFDKAKWENSMEKTKAALAASQGVSDMMKAPDLNNPFFQEKFNEQFYNDTDKYVQQFAKDHPENWQTLLKSDPEFQRMVGNYSVIAKQQDAVFNKMTEAIAGHASGSLVLAPEELDAANKFVSGVSNFGNEGFSSVSLQDEYQKVNAAMAFQDWFNTSGLLDNIKPQIESSLSMIKDRTNIDTYNKESKKVYDAAAEAIAEDLTRPGGMYYNSKVYTKDYIKKYVSSILGNEITSGVEAIQTNDVPYNNDGGMAEWQWNAMNNEQKKIGIIETIRKAVTGEAVGAMVGKQYAGGTVSNERLFKPLSKDQMDKYVDDHRGDIINPNALKPNTRYDILTVVVKGTGGVPDKVKYAFINLDDPSAASAYGASLKDGKDAPEYPSSDEIHQALTGKTNPSNGTGDANATPGGAPIIR